MWVCERTQRANRRYVKEAPFVNRRYTEGVRTFFVKNGL